MKALTRLLPVFGVLLASPFLSASTYYVSQAGLTSLGSSRQSAPANITAFNTGGNWSTIPGTAGKVSPGDTVHLVGNITTALTVEGSGTAGNPITILFDPGATMSVPAWAATGAIVINGRNYITIDGGATGTIGGMGGNPGLVNGIIQNTDNGTNLGNHTNSVGIWAASCDNLIVRNLEISNLYVRSRGAEQNGYGDCVKYFWNGGATTYGSSTVTNCIFHDAYTGCSFAYKVSTNLTYSYCTAYNCNWGGNAADSEAGATLTGLNVHDNRFYNWTNWDDTSASNSFHHNGFFGWAAHGGGSALTTVRYYNNYIGPNYSTAGDPTNHSSSGLFVQYGVSDVLVYNNVFVANPKDNPSDGFIYLNPSASVTSTYGVYNNTFVGGNTGIGLNFTPNGAGAGTQTVMVENNLTDAVATPVSVFHNGTVTLASSYNLFYNIPNLSNEFNWSATGSSSFKSITGWQGLGYDLNARNGNPNLNTNYVPQSPSAAIDAGADLSALDYFTTDIIATPRPQGTAWDIGAYQFVQTVPTVATQPSPQSVALTVTPASQTNASDDPSAMTSSASDVNLTAVVTSASAPTYTSSDIAATPDTAPTVTAANTSTSEPGYLVNLSARANVGTGNNILIGGFGVGGTGTEQLLVRGIGPALFDLFGLSGNLAKPELTLLDNSGLVIAGNTGWGENPMTGPSPLVENPEAASSAAMSAVGAFAPNPGSADTALAVTAPVGNSTVQVSGVGNSEGIALVEVYDADPGPSTARLVNLSARAYVGTGNNILIGGFTIGGSTPETVLIRAVGPGLTDSANLTGTLAHPVLTLFSAGAPIGSNTGWGGNAAIAAAAAAVGAFPLNPAHQDSAMLVTLPPGSYTAQVGGANGGVGIALIEIYEVR